MMVRQSSKINGETTFFLFIFQVIPMLPQLLCEQLCSLNPDEDRLTFSVVWKMTEKGEVILIDPQC